MGFVSICALPPSFTGDMRRETNERKVGWLILAHSGEDGVNLMNMGEPFQAVVLGDASNEPTCRVPISWANQ